MSKNRFSIITRVAFFLLLASCKNKMDKAYEPYQDLLQSETFRAISDSVNTKPSSRVYALRSAMAIKMGQEPLAWLDAMNAWRLDKNILAANAITNIVTSSKHNNKYTLALKDIVTVFPSEFKFRRTLQLCYYNEKLYKEALLQNDTIFAIIGNKNVSGIDFLLQDRGKLFLEVGDTTNGIKNLQASLHVNPLYDDAAFELANVLANKGDATVLTLCDQIIKFDSMHTKVEPYYFKAVYYDKINNVAAAIAALEKGVKQQWTFKDGWLLMGDIYLRQNDLQKAEEAFNKALTIKKADADAWYGLAQIAEKKGDKETANINYERAYGFDNELVAAKEGIERTKK